MNRIRGWISRMNRSAVMRRFASVRARDRDFGSRSWTGDGSSVARVRSVDERRARSTATGDSICSSIHPSVRDARAAFDRAPSEPRAVQRRAQPTARRSRPQKRRAAKPPNRRRAIDSIRIRVVDRSRTIDRSTVDSIRFRDGRREFDARDDLGEARRTRGRPFRTARADACADARSANARCRTRTCRAGGRWRCARGGRRSERCRARSRE